MHPLQPHTAGDSRKDGPGTGAGHVVGGGSGQNSRGGSGRGGAGTPRGNGAEGGGVGGEFAPRSRRVSDPGRGDGDDADVNGGGGDARARRSAATRKNGGDESQHNHHHHQSADANRSPGNASGNASRDRRKSGELHSTGNNRHKSHKSEYKPGDAIADIDTLARAIAACDAGDVARVLSQSQFRPGAPAFTTLIKTCGRSGGWDKALELYQAMKQRGVAANTITCSALINACGKSKQWEKALDVFREMKADGVEANIFTYSALISACAKGRQLDKALQVFRECQSAGVEPDAITYGTVIAACEKGRRCDDALDVFRQMRDKNVDANVITYNSVLSACDRAGRADDALEIFELMRREGIKPDKHSYAAVIGACATGGRLDDAMATYRAGCRAVDPDPALYAAAMQACAAPGSAHAGDAAGIWRDMRERLPDQTPGASTAASCVSACEAAGNFRQMLDVVGVAGDVHDARRDEEAEAAANAVVTEAEAKLARAKDAPPSVLTAAAILSGRTAAADAKIAAEAALIAAKRDARIASLQTRAKGVRTDLPQASYASLMTACERGGLSSRAVDVFAAARAASFIKPHPPHPGSSSASSASSGNHPTGNQTQTQILSANSDPAWHERALRAAHAGGLGADAVEILRSMASECAGGATAGARASALGACVASPAGSLEGTRAASTVWAFIKSAVRAHAMAEGRSGLDARPATQACRAAGACAAKEGDVELAADVLAVVEAGPDDDARTDASVLASCAAAFAVAGDAAKAAETLGRNADGDALASALAAVGAAGAGGSVLATLSDAACLRACGGVAEGTCAAVVACASDGKGGDARINVQRAVELLGAWGETHACAAAAAKRLEEGARALEGKVSSSPAPGSPVAKGGAPGAEGTAQAARGSPAVKEGTSFAFAAGARSKPAEKPSADSGADSGADTEKRKGGRESHAEKRAASQGKKRGDGEGGKKGNKQRGQGTGGNKGGHLGAGGGGRGWGGAAASKPLIASSASFVPASAVKAAPFVPLSKRQNSADLAAAAAKLSVEAPAFTPRAAAPEFVPKSKD